MEVNLVRHSFIPDSVISALKDNCTICINGKKSKDLLVYYITNEFTRQYSKSSAVLYKTPDSKGYIELKNWVDLHSNLRFVELNDFEELFDADILPRKHTLYTVPVDSVLMSSKKDLIAENICLYVLDLTSDHICESLLTDLRPIFNLFDHDNMRIIVLVDIGVYLDCFKNFNELLSTCRRGLPFEIKFASDTVAIGRNGNLIETKTIEVLNKVVATDPLFHTINQYLETCKNAVSFYMGSRCTCNEGNILLHELTLITQHFEMLGTMAFSVSLNRFDELVQSKIENIEDPGELLLILKLLRTKNLVLKATMDLNASHSAQESSVSLALKRGLDYVKDFLSECNREWADKRRVAFVVESIESAEVLYLMVHMLKSVNGWEYLDKCSIFLMDENLLDDMILNNDALFVTSVKSPHLHRLKLDRCISFCVPSDYCMSLDIKRSLKRRSGTLYVLVSLDDGYARKLEKIDDFRRIEAAILSRIPSYINPNAAMLSSLFADHGLCTFHSQEYQISPEEAISVMNRYCNFLNSGMSQAAIDYDFSTYCDGFNDSDSDVKVPCSKTLSAQTKMFLPLKSMVRVPVQAPIMKLPRSDNVTKKLQMLSRVTSCLEVCKMLYENNDDLFASMMTKAKDCTNRAIVNDNILTQNRVNRKEIPVLLKDSFPKPNSIMYIYVIKTRRVKDSSVESFQKYLGFCSTKPLKKFPSFLIYNRAERLVKSICRVEKCQILTETSCRPMYNFDVYIRAKVLGYDIFVNEADSSVDNQSNGVLWTVLKQEDDCYNIDYEFLERFRVFRTGSKVNGFGFYNTRPTSFECSHFEDKVVAPLHRSNLDAFYFVKDIRRDILIDDELSLHSTNVTFKDYYQLKYGITLTSDQFMAEVLPVQKHLNFLEPRYQEEGSPKISSKRRQKTILPTELCLVHPIPAHLWSQIVTIPVLLHRISSLLYLDELGQILIQELDLDESDEGPCVDENLCTLINEIHKGKDRTGLQRVEDALTELIGVHRCNSSHILSKEFVLFDVETEENFIGQVDNGPMKEEAPFQEIEAFGKEKQLYIENKSENLVFLSDACNKNNEKFGADENLIENTDLIAETTETQDEKGEMPPLSLMLVAMTSADAQDMFTYERLEFLGDAFLAFSIAAELFLHNKTKSDNFLSRKRAGIVSNVELCAKGYRRKLWKYMVANKFDFRCNALVDRLLYITASRQVDCQCHYSKLYDESGSASVLCSCQISEEHDIRAVSDSSLATGNLAQDVESDCFDEIVRNSIVADCIEALIGLFYVHNGEIVTLNLMNWLGFDVCCVRKMQFGDGSKFIGNVAGVECLPTRTDSEVVFSMAQARYSYGHRNQGMDSGQKCTRVELDPKDKFSRASNASENSDELEAHRDRKLYSDVSSGSFKVSEMKLGNDHVGLSLYMSQQLFEFENILKYEFIDKNKLLEALLHPSYLCRFAPPVNCNQRLEFLGDSVIYLLVADYICRKYPKSTNAELTDMRCIIVNTKTFAKIAYLYGFHRYLMVVSAGFSEQLLGWSKIIEEERKDGNLWPKWSMSNLASFHESPLPKLSIPKDLADVFESVAAAIFVDSGRLDLVWRTFYLLLKDALDSLP